MCCSTPNRAPAGRTAHPRTGTLARRPGSAVGRLPRPRRLRLGQLGPDHLVDDVACDRPRREPTSARICDRDAWSMNSSGSPSSFTPVSTPAARRSCRSRVPTPPTRTPSSIVMTRRWSRDRSMSDDGIGTTQRGSTTVAPMPCASSSSAASSATGTIDPTATISTSCSCDSPGERSTSTPSDSRRSAGMSGPTEPFDHRSTVGASSTATASRNSSRSVAASRGAAIRIPGTTCSSARSHIPWCDGPSGPVMPARSSTKVTPARCRATSISTWSNARLRNVA